MIFTDVITLYNHKADGTWKRVPLQSVMVVRSLEKVIDGDGVLKHVPIVKITIPHRWGYYDPADYYGAGFTFGLDNLDIITLGHCKEELTEDNFSAFKRRPDTWTIKAVQDNTNRDHLPHWLIICEG